MNSKLFHLVYKSNASEDMPLEKIQEIVRVSQKNNAAIRVTGMLMYIEGNFLQVLEGEQEIVENLYHKIVKDSRHLGIKKILGGPIDKRSFPKWSMGMKIYTCEDHEDLKKINNDYDFDLYKELTANKSILLEMMRYFYTNENLDFKYFWTEKSDPEFKLIQEE